MSKEIRRVSLRPPPKPPASLETKRLIADLKKLLEDFKKERRRW